MNGLDTYRPWMAGHLPMDHSLKVTAGMEVEARALGAPIQPEPRPRRWSWLFTTPAQSLALLPTASVSFHEDLNIITAHPFFLARNWPVLESGSGLARLSPRMLEGNAQCYGRRTLTDWPHAVGHGSLSIMPALPCLEL